MNIVRFLYLRCGVRLYLGCVCVCVVRRWMMLYSMMVVVIIVVVVRIVSCVDLWVLFVVLDVVGCLCWVVLVVYCVLEEYVVGYL